jgi:hypothetical protein
MTFEVLRMLILLPLYLSGVLLAWAFLCVVAFLILGGAGWAQGEWLEYRNERKPKKP